MMKGKKSNVIYKAHFSFTFSCFGLVFRQKDPCGRWNSMCVFQNVFPSPSMKHDTAALCWNAWRTSCYLLPTSFLLKPWSSLRCWLRPKLGPPTQRSWSMKTRIWILRSLHHSSKLASVHCLDTVLKPWLPLGWVPWQRIAQLYPQHQQFIRA